MVLGSLSFWYSRIPPNAETVQSAPDVFGNIVRSASIARSRTAEVSGLVNRLITDAAAATQHADDDPSPAPIGMSDWISIVIPFLKLWSLITSLAIKKNGRNFFSTVSTSSVIGIVAFPNDDVMDIAVVSFFSDVTVTRLFIAPTTARVPWTTTVSYTHLTLPTTPYV